MTNPHSGAKTPSNPSPPSATDDAWSATRTQTEIVTQVMEHGERPGQVHEIGRPVGDNVRELFVSCEPGLALQQQFEHLQPDFIAVHDIQTALSAKLLAGVAAASRRAVQKLVIRRQGYGNTLATLSFVELPTAAGATLRLYATGSDADTASRHTITRSLLGHSRLGVILVGDVPAHSLAAAFKPLQDDMISGPWPNRQLLLLPLSSANAVATLGMELSRSSGVNVRTTPTVTRPADAWNFISGTWSRLNSNGQPPPRPAPVRPSAPPSPPPVAFNAPTQPMSLPGGFNAPTQPMSMPTPLQLRPMPETSRSATPSRDPMTRYVQQLVTLNGMVSCCVLEVATGRLVAHAGAGPRGPDLAEHGAALLAEMLQTSRALGLGHALPDATITLGANHLVLRAVPRNPGLALSAVLDKAQANITLARLQIVRLDAMFDED